MNDQATQIKQAKKFAHKWSNYHGKEDGHVGSFWYGLLGNVYGVPNVFSYFEREKPVPNFNNKNKDSIDGYIKKTRVIVEQKAPKWSLDKPEMRKSLGGYVTPFQQAHIYNSNLPYDEQARFIITSNFHEIWIYNLSKQSHPKPVKILVSSLPSNLKRLYFLLDTNDMDTASITDLSKTASEDIADIYKGLVSQCKKYGTPENGLIDNHGHVTNHALRELNKLCVRLVFCFYANYASIFNRKHGFGMFRRYLMKRDDWRDALLRLFHILETPNQKRSPFDSLRAFHYTDGGLFADKIDIPPIDANLKHLILKALNFDWSQISPTIFGSMFESTLNPTERKDNGMHYTSIENIHKVIDPLFLNKLRKDLKHIEDMDNGQDQVKAAEEYQDHLASLRFLDPACGSGNFLTETYLCLRRLENQAIRIIYINNFTRNKRYQNWVYTSSKLRGRKVTTDTPKEYQTQFNLGGNDANIIKVNINQFYGIEIDDFAVSVARTAMWIAESQMYQKTQDILSGHKDFLPLKANSNITEGNALTINWDRFIPANDLNYIISNPPFKSSNPTSHKNDVQKKTFKAVMKGFKGYGKLDFCAAWFKKSADMMQLNKSLRTALVATKSITQGQQLPVLWGPLFKDYKLHIDFAYKTFLWTSEVTNSANVDCVIVGFSHVNVPKVLFNGGNHKQVKNINPYLRDLPNFIVTKRNTPLNKNVPPMVSGSKVTDDRGEYTKFKPKDVKRYEAEYPITKGMFKPLLTASSFMKAKSNNDIKYCLYLTNVPKHEWLKVPFIKKRVIDVKTTRENSHDKGTNKAAAWPQEFQNDRQPDSNYLIIPAVTGDRPYRPIGFGTPDQIITNTCLYIKYKDHDPYYMFGILSSIVHMTWIQLTAGRHRNAGYNYSSKLVYNTFPWPNATPEQRKQISDAGKNIMKVRSSHPDDSLADLYTPAGLDQDLQQAHSADNKAVFRAYGLKLNADRNQIINKLLNMYAQSSKRLKF